MPAKIVGVAAKRHDNILAPPAPSTQRMPLNCHGRTWAKFSLPPVVLRAASSAASYAFSPMPKGINHNNRHYDQANQVEDAVHALLPQEVTPPRVHSLGGAQNEGGGQSLVADNRRRVNVRRDRRSPEQQAGVRDNRMLCVPLMGNESRLTPCLLR
jgi:hypothetical protein